MIENLGNTDKIVRIFIGLAIVLMGVEYESWWGLVGFIFPITAVINWCPIYAFFGIRTSKDKGRKLI
ncbi:MAG TPA: DUF2892 domain-containing protein [Bacteroidia bacterium]|nr:DUF2892 domain-containing protein [Bacteroidia bacterium]HRH08133.1 DUF2892 domain-containing protein [Bacteroidia bacterium]HRH62173.1 DUF2892 domain-containing protein [Bacteroidia bacterium]